MNATDTSSGTDGATRVDATALNPGDPIGDTGFRVPETPICGICKVGVLTLTVWDPEALHEKGQPIFYPAKLSGGAFAYTCPNCGEAQSVPIAPQDAPANPNPSA